MNYERVLLMIKSRCESLYFKIKTFEGCGLEHGNLKFYEFLERALSELRDEYDELNAAYSLLEKQSA